MTQENQPASIGLRTPGLIFAGIVLLKLAEVGAPAGWSWWFVAGLLIIWLSARMLYRSLVMAGQMAREEQEERQKRERYEELFKAFERKSDKK